MKLRPAPRYHFDPDDRITIHDVQYRPLGSNEAGHVLMRLVEPLIAESHTHEDIARLIDTPHFHVEHRYFSPQAAEQRLRDDTALFSTRPESVQKRAFWRELWVDAFNLLYERKIVKKTGSSIDEHKLLLTGTVVQLLKERRGSNKRSHTFNSLQMRDPPSGKSILDWMRDYEAGGLLALCDDLPRSGNRRERLEDEEAALLAREVRGYMKRGGPEKSQILKNVKNAFNARNEERKAQGLPPLAIPSRNKVYAEINALDPFQVCCARYGLEKALKKFRPVGKGLEVTRPLQRVEMDEWQVDLVTLAIETGVYEIMSPEERKKIEKVRRWLTVAVDCCTEVILAMRLSPTPSAAVSIATLEMITEDKGQWADAVGALTPWGHSGTPMTVVTDGGVGKSYEFRQRVTDLGGRVERPPAGQPSLRSRVERTFRTVGTDLVPRLTGRTFSNVIQRDGYPSEDRAGLFDDDLAFAIIRWVVDIHHNRSHEGLNGATPFNAWRKAEAEWGTTPPPDATKRRLVFGTRLKSTVTNGGITVLGVQYHSEALHRWAIHQRKREVQVRWHPNDIGVISVEFDGGWHNVGAVHETFHGVKADEWLPAIKALRANNKLEAEIAEPIVRKAIQAIRDMNAAAEKRADLSVPDWSAERLEREENSLFIGFHVAKLGGDATSHVSAQPATGLFANTIEITPQSITNSIPNSDNSPEAVRPKKSGNWTLE
ncbi:Mu transposase C-terminal domain-containing protein [Microvirga vignae]|uniref:Mu transposase C-terminal domain-containing protein n=1 Tax=Microvirga vignae TaxID=1225564 RepID=UPI00069B95A2|nr:Mu transposase C-terminal domain-containing protein [Microvirga vignae]